LADIFARLAIVETEMKKVAKRGNNKATEDQSIRRSLRRGNNDQGLISGHLDQSKVLAHVGPEVSVRGSTIKDQME
jgi:hypothetical protein